MSSGINSETETAPVRPNRIPRVLFFIAGMNPTDEERKKAERFLPNLGFRNSRMVADTPMSALEECDAVAGDNIPARYAATYPSVNDFGEERMLRLSDLYLPHGNVTDPNNEAARAAKPDSNSNAGRNPSQGQPTMAGAITHPSGGGGAIGGYAAPVPARSGVPFLGSESANNPPPGGATPATNPQAVPAGGLTAQRTGQEVPSVSTGAPAPGNPGSGFANPAAGGAGGSTASAASGDGLEDRTRAELDKLAAERGLDTTAYPNKGAVIEALRKGNGAE